MKHIIKIDAFKALVIEPGPAGDAIKVIATVAGIKAFDLHMDADTAEAIALALRLTAAGVGR